MDAFQLHRGDCLQVLKTLADNSVDSIVTDPPYGLSDQSVDELILCMNAWLAGEVYKPKGKGFMGKAWDAWVPGPEVWRECLRVLKPGGHLLAFAGTRTQHLMALSVALAGFEIRDMIAWVYGSGFPKSLDVSKAIDKARDDSAEILRVTTFMADAADRAGLTRADVDAALGTSDMGGWWLSRLQHRCKCPKWDQWIQLKALLLLGDEMDVEVWRLNGRKGKPGDAWSEREVVGKGAAKLAQGQFNAATAGAGGYGYGAEYDITTPATDAARQWEGWGTALKPALEPITFARKPLAGTVAANVLEHGTGALNIDGCRVEPTGESKSREHEAADARGDAGSTNLAATAGAFRGGDPSGRWPANLIHDGSDEVLAAFPAQAGGGFGVRGSETGGAMAAQGVNKMHRDGRKDAGAVIGYGDSGSAARFFYCAKASRSDRNEGMPAGGEPAVGTGATMREREDADWPARNGNFHPTVKPTDLMRYLVRLVTPPGGRVLDPYMGSGSTGKACALEGFAFTGIERDEDEDGQPLGYLDIASARIAWAHKFAAEEAARMQESMAQGNLFGGEMVA